MAVNVNPTVWLSIPSRIQGLWPLSGFNRGHGHLSIPSRIQGSLMTKLESFAISAYFQFLLGFRFLPRFSSTIGIVIRLSIPSRIQAIFRMVVLEKG